MTAKYIQPGNAISYQNNGDTDILACETVPLGTRVAIAGDTIKAGETGTLMLTGIWEMETDGSVFAVGDPVYYDSASGKVTAGGSTAAAEGEDAASDPAKDTGDTTDDTTEETGNVVLAGIATTAATADDTTVCVKIG